MSSQEHSGINHFLAEPGPREFAAPMTESLGAAIRALRESHGWGVADVSARLKFGVRQIEALEADRWEELPQGPSLRGLVRNYARLLGVPPETFMDALPAHLQQQASGTTASLAPVGVMPHSTLPRWEGRRRSAWPTMLLVLFLICVLALAAYLVFAWWLPRNAEQTAAEPIGFPLAVDPEPLALETLSSRQSITPVETPAAGTPPEGAASGSVSSSATGDAPAVGPSVVSGAAAGQPASELGGAPSPDVSEPAMPTPAGAPQTDGQQAAAPVAGAAATAGPMAAEPQAATPAATGNQLAFEVSAASWVEVRDASGSVVLSSTLQPGAGPQIEATPPLRLVIGNASGVSLRWQGNAVDLSPHQRGNVARLTLQ